MSGRGRGPGLSASHTLIFGLLAGLLEEFGWSVFAFPALQARFGLLGAGAAVGVIMAVWHLRTLLLNAIATPVSMRCRYRTGRWAAR